MNEINYFVLTNDNICIDIGFNDELKTRITIGKGKNSAVFITQEEGDRSNVIKFPIEYLSLFKNDLFNNTDDIKLIDFNKKYEEKYKHIDSAKIKKDVADIKREVSKEGFTNKNIDKTCNKSNINRTI